MMRALIADGDPVRRRALEEELARQGFEIGLAATAQAVLAAAAADDPQLVVVATRVGEDDGLELCRALRAVPGAQERVVVLVGPPSELAVLDALQAGASDVWPVPRPEAAGESHLGLRVKLAEHYARLQAEHVRLGGEFALLRQALDLTGTGFVMTDPLLEDDPIVYANTSFYDMTGYAPEEVLGRNCRFLQGPETDRADVERLRRALAADRPVTLELINHRADGTPFNNEVHISPVRDGQGRVVRRVGVQVDVTAYRERERLFVLEQSARVQAEASDRRSTFLAEASPLLDASLDLRSTLDSLTRLSVPFLGGICLVEEVAGDEVTRVAAAAADPAVERIVRALPTRHLVADRENDPLARVVRTGRSEILAATEPSLLGPAATASGVLGDQLRQSAMIVPLRARGRIIGALAFLALESERRYTAEDLALAEELGRRAALALDNARLYERQSEVASALQASLLPSRLPEVPGVELAARFRPAGDGSVVGGDFYDVIAAADGFDVVVGDVTGKGARAAALTGLARHTLRTAARYETAPSGVLGVLNDALIDERVSAGRYCTVALARVRVRPEGGLRATICVGGHPLPIVLRADGHAEPVGRPGSILGWISDPTLRDVDVDIEPGESLVLYTDGVSEARTPDGMLGDERLAAVLESTAGMPAGAVASRLERAALQFGNPRDDVAIVVVRGEAPAVPARLDAQEAA